MQTIQPEAKTGSRREAVVCRGARAASRTCFKMVRERRSTIRVSWMQEHLQFSSDQPTERAESLPSLPHRANVACEMTSWLLSLARCAFRAFDVFKFLNLNWINFSRALVIAHPPSLEGVFFPSRSSGLGTKGKGLDRRQGRLAAEPQTRGSTCAAATLSDETRNNRPRERRGRNTRSKRRPKMPARLSAPTPPPAPES